MHVGLLSIPGTTAMIALALGYIVVVLANKEKGRLKSYGYIIGVAIIITSSLLILAKVLWITTGATKCDRILMHQKMMMQEREPLKMMPPAPVPKK
jgi:hypothetical protein